MLRSYSSKPISEKPKWFNGFIRLDQYSKNYNWNKYIYLPNYYSEKEDKRKKQDNLKIEKNTISDIIIKHYKNRKEESLRTKTKTEKCIKMVRQMDILNLDTGFLESHPFVFANENYAIRPVEKSDIGDVKRIANLAKEEIEINIRFGTLKKSFENGLMVLVINKKGCVCGLQTFSFMDRQISHEPLTWIDDEARGQGIFNVYQNIVVDLGKEINAKYVYNQCNPQRKIAQVYEHYGYVLQKRKVTETGGQQYAVYHFSLEEENQQTFF